MSAEREGGERHIVTDPILQKDFFNGMQNFFNQLPDEHQAVTAYKFVNEALSGSWGPWLKEAIETRLSNEAASTLEAYSVTSINRQHLSQMGFTEEDVKALDDGDLRRIAEKMKIYYEAGEFWDDFVHATQQVLTEKPESDSEETSTP